LKTSGNHIPINNIHENNRKKTQKCTSDGNKVSFAYLKKDNETIKIPKKRIAKLGRKKNK